MSNIHNVCVYVYYTYTHIHIHTYINSAQDTCVRIIVDWMMISCPCLTKGVRCRLPVALPLERENYGEPKDSYITEGTAS
jgi:hypothetical protein